MFSRFFIDRPRFAAVLSILIVISGVIGMLTLPIAQFPEISPPTVEIKARYPGASAQTVAEAVAAPIGQQLSGAEGLLYYQSQSANDGSCVVTVTFDIGTDLALAAVDVQNRVKLAESRLPQVVLQQGLEIRKKSTSILLVAALSSSDPRIDALYLNNYASINVLDALKRVPGVGDATVYGAGDYAMRLWVDPARMAQKSLAISDITRAVQEQNGLYAAGRIGQQPSPSFSPTTVPVITRGRLEEPAEFESIILRAEPGGALLRLGDVGRAELGSLSYDLFGRLNAKPSTLIIVNLQPGANALATAKGVKETLDELSRTFPQGVTPSIPYDTTQFIRVSIKQVVQTFIEAAVLVLIVVFVFLQSFRATLVPLIAVPVSIVGTFMVMSVLGFTINTLTLFGLVLAIGIVVDDAIIVIENVERLMHGICRHPSNTNRTQPERHEQRHSDTTKWHNLGFRPSQRDHRGPDVARAIHWPTSECGTIRELELEPAGRRRRLRSQSLSVLMADCPCSRVSVDVPAMAVRSADWISRARARL